jgi:probable phosphoglycerate mutase
MTRHRCVLIRHGETEWSRDGRHTGRTDLPLLPEGKTQAEALAPILAGYEFASVLTSPLIRARETSELAGLGGVAVVDPDLAEWDYGSYEGLTTEEIRRQRPGWDLFDDGAPGGESAGDVRTRVDRVIERVRDTPGDVACVAHAHVLRVLGARWIGLEADGGRCFVLGPASFSELGWERTQPAISRWNVR